MKGDANCDGSIGAADLAAIALESAAGSGECERTDVDRDGTVGDTDRLEEIGIVFPPFEEFVAMEGDFECLTSWPKVRRFRITNKLGRLDETLAVAHGELPPPYPPGTIVQLIPNEAMVKRGGNFDLDNSNWEYFVIDPNGGDMQIVQRGRDEVRNAPIPCFQCHSAARDISDFICETTNGCIALGIPGDLIDRIQENDPRCASAATR